LVEATLSDVQSDFYGGPAGITFVTSSHVMEKFDACLATMLDKFEARLEKMNGDLLAAN